ncbi:MAG: glycosyl hydrolase [Cyclobacteriaceae bacterium]
MKKIINLNFVLIFLIMVSFSACKQKKETLAIVPETIPEVNQLLDYIYSLKGEKTLSGQHNYSHDLKESHDSVMAITGKLPAIWGSDFIGKMHRQDMVAEAIDQHKKGSIITLMYHQPRPYADSMGHFRDSINAEDWQQLVTPGTAIHQTWLQDIDSVAYYLKILQDNQVPVLWRPYHEMNGIWFWWCNKRGEDGFKKLWKMMYDRFTNHHQLKNLIWVWNPNAPRDWENDNAFAYELFFPGLEHVDILATDVYKGDWKQSHHDDLLALAGNKPIAIGECGDLPPPDLFDTQPQWTWFMVWAQFIYNANTPAEVNAIYSLPRVLTLDEITVEK